MAEEAEGSVIVPPEQPANEPLRTYVRLRDEQGKPLELHSISGAKTTGEFAQAVTDYSNTGKVPEGFREIDPQTINDAMKIFNQAKEFVQPKVAAFGREAFQNMSSGGLVGTEPITTGTGAQILPDPSMQAQKQTAGKAGQFLGNTAASMFDTPEKLGMFVGTLAVQPLLGPVNVAARTATKALDEAAPYVFSYGGAGMNMLKNAAFAGAGGLGMNAITGQPMTAKNVTDTAFNAGLAGIAAGPQALVQHFVTRNVPIERQKEVAQGILDAVVKANPLLKNDPNALAIGLTGKKGLTAVGEQMSNSLQGGLNSVTRGMTHDILNVLPFRVSIGTQNTLRAGVRKLASAGSNMLDTMHGDATAYNKATTAFADAQQELGILIRNEIASYAKGAGIQFTPQVLGNMGRNVSNILQQYKQQLTQFEEGTRVAGYLKKAIGPQGFEADRLKNALLKDSYSGTQGTLLPDVRSILAGGGDLQQLPRFTEPGAPLHNFVQSHLPRWSRLLVRPQPLTPTNVPTLPSQLPVAGMQAPIMLNLGVQSAGREAMERATNSPGIRP